MTEVFEDPEAHAPDEDVRSVKRWLIALTIVLTATFFMGAIGWIRVYQVANQECSARREARDAVRALVTLVTQPQDTNGDGVIDYIPDQQNGIVIYLKHTLLPGEALEEITC